MTNDERLPLYKRLQNTTPEAAANKRYDAAFGQIADTLNSATLDPVAKALQLNNLSEVLKGTGTEELMGLGELARVFEKCLMLGIECAAQSVEKRFNKSTTSTYEATLGFSGSLTLQKGGDGHLYLEGYASTEEVDRDGDKMSKRAL